MEEYNNATLTAIESQLESAVESYRREVDEVLKSEHPKYTGNPALREYDAAELKKEFEREVGDIRANYKETSETLLKTYEGAAVLSSYPVNELEKSAVSGVLNDFKANYMLAYGKEEQQAAISKLKTAISHLTVGGMAHVRQKLGDIMPSFAGDDAVMQEFRHLNSTLSEIKTPQQIAYEGVKQQSASGGDTAYRQLKLTHKTYGNHADDSLQSKTLEQLGAEEEGRGSLLRGRNSGVL